MTLFDDLVEEWRNDELPKFLVAMDQVNPLPIEALADEWILAHGGRVSDLTGDAQ